MQLSGLQIAVAVLVPLILAVTIWLACRRAVRLGWLGLAFVLGVAVTVPIIRFGNAVELWIGDWTGHFYADELIRQFLTTALPEEWGKGLVAVLVWRLTGKPTNPLSWVSCAAAAHGGFAALEGLLGALGNEGLLKVVVGRSMGAMLHCSWGIIAAWFAWCGWQRGQFRMLSWSMALLFPSVLHSVGNASMIEIPSDAASASSDTISATELMVVLPGMASFVVSWAMAGWCLYAARKVPIMPPIPHIQ